MKEPTAAPGAGRVLSVGKAMDLLACLAQARAPLSLGELSRRTGIPKATAHGLPSAMRPSAVVGMLRRVDPPELERAAGMLLEAARRISFDLGYRG